MNKNLIEFALSNNYIFEKFSDSIKYEIQNNIKKFYKDLYLYKKSNDYDHLYLNLGKTYDNKYCLLKYGKIELKVVMN